MIIEEQRIPLKNVTEEIVRGLVRFLLHGPEYPTYCNCETCEEKIVAIALNELPVKYVVTNVERERAFVYLKQPKLMEEINRQVIHGIHLIGQKNQQQHT